MTACPECGRDVDRDRLFDERACPHCQTALDALYRIAAGLPTRRDKSGVLWGRYS